MNPPLLNQLAALSTLCMQPCAQRKDVADACEVVRRAVAAEESYIIQSGDPHFTRLCSSEDPTQYEIKQKGYWLVWQRLASNPNISVALFDVRERLVEGGEAANAGSPGSHLASILPGDESNSEMLIVRGPWPNGISQEQLDFLVAARPMLAHLVSSLLDSQRQARHREQLGALADVSKAFSEAGDMESVLTSIATALAKASGFDWVMIRVYNDTLDATVDQAINVARHSQTETAALMQNGGLIGQAGKAQPVFGLHMAESGKPLLIPDVFSDNNPVPSERYRDLVPLMQAYYQRAHILSMAFFPIMFQHKMLGLVNFASATKHDLDDQEVAFLWALVSQAATTIKGLRLYHDLEQSKQALRAYAEQLEEASRVEHLLARTDALTGLPNRRCFEEALRVECARAQRYQQPLSLVMADVDYFKRVNDGYGHRAGDEGLKFVADIARSSCRTSDVVGRWGGDEFVFILPQTPLSEAQVFAERFRTALAASSFIQPKMDEALQLTISMGVAEANQQASVESELLVEQADRALYRAKDLGRNRVELANGSDRAAA